MIRFRHFAVALIGAMAAVAEVHAVQLDLPAAVDRAIEANPVLAAVAETRRQVAGGIREARADAFPQIALVSSWSQSRSPSLLNSPDFGEILDQFPGASFEPATQELTRAVVEVTQPIWTFGKVGAAIDLAELAASVAEERVTTAELDTAQAVAETYYRVLAAREGLATIEADREFRLRDLERVSSLLEIGEATELERLRAEAAVAEVEPEVARRQGEVSIVETQLRRLLALPADEPLDLVPVVGEPPVPPSVDELVAAGLDNRSEIDDLELQLEIFDKRRTVTVAEGRPQVEFAGSWGREVRRIDDFSDPLYSAWAASLGLRWELFDGGRRRGQIEQLASERRQTALTLDDLRARIGLEIGQTDADYRTARARAAAARSSALAAREALRVARENYEQGIATQTDLLDAQSRSTLADTLAVTTYYDTLVQASRLARSIGRMPTAGWSLVSEAPREN